ncbi:hypothetical protein OQA88_9326 [Cercophora sp. LCS_1]
MPCKLAISSMSLGWSHAGHSLAHRLDMAQKYSYRGIELFHTDLLAVASTIPNPTDDPFLPQLLAASAIRSMCAARNLAIICLQPFMHYEGLLDRTAHDQHIEKLRLWLQLAHLLGTDIVQIPSNFLPESELSSDIDLIVSDLREVAEMGMASNPPVRFVYEALGWGTRVSRWEQAWEVVERVDMPNFGICLDTFNIACAIYADPASEDPRRAVPGGEEEVRASMRRLVERVDPAKVFYVQVVDAKRLEEPLVEGHEYFVEGQPARMSWSRKCRLFYGEFGRGAYLPVREIAMSIFGERGLGWEGWVSLELFNERMSDEDEGAPEELARRGARSWGKLVRDCGLRIEEDVMASASL